MQDLCPLCLQNGLKKKIRLFQVNLQEAVWMCEEEKCVWPLGCENFAFCQRLVGKIWSCYWDDNSPPRLKENVTLPSKSCMTSIKDKRECISPVSDTNSSENSISIINTVDLKCNNNDLHISTEEKQEKNKEEKCNVNNETFYSKLDDNNLQSNSDKLKNENIENERVNSINKHIKEETGVCIRNIKNINDVKGIPKITSIEKSSTDISNIQAANQEHQDQSKDILSKNILANDIEHNLSLPLNDKNQSITTSVEYTKLSTSEPSKNDRLLNGITTAKPNLSVTMMRIDGLPPITLAFEMPVSTTAPEIVTSSIQRNDSKKSVIERVTGSNSLDMKNTLMKRNVSSGKQYEKFSFSAIKKKMEKNISTEASSNSNNSPSVKPNLATMKNVESNSVDNVKKASNVKTFHDSQSIASYNKDSKQIVATTDISDTSMLNQINNNESNTASPEVSNNQRTTSDTVTSTAVNIETVLTDFLTNDYSVSEDINEEWLNSLLN